jgi:hypothetical protein
MTVISGYKWLLIATFFYPRFMIDGTMDPRLTSSLLSRQAGDMLLPAQGRLWNG